MCIAVFHNLVGTY